MGSAPVGIGKAMSTNYVRSLRQAVSKCSPWAFRIGGSPLLGSARAWAVMAHPRPPGM